MKPRNKINIVAEILAREPEESCSYCALRSVLKEELGLDEGPWAAEHILNAVEAGFIEIDDNNKCALIVPLLKAIDEKAA
jgi:hypothetical protein